MNNQNFPDPGHPALPKEILELFFSQSLHGFFICMLDEPLEWHDGVDKEKALDYVLEHQRMTLVNQAMLDQYGAREEDFVGITIGELFRHDLGQARRIWRGLFDRGRRRVETRERRLDGTPIVIDGDYTCLYDGQGRITGHFGVQVDVTERKMVEEELRVSKETISGIIDSAPYSIQLLDPEGYTERVNPAFVELFGVAPPPDYTILSDPNFDRSEIYRNQMKRLAAGERVHFPEFYYNTRLVSPRLPDNPMWIRASGFPLLDAEGNIKNLVLIHEDITERKRAEEELLRSEERFKNILFYAPLAIQGYRSDGTVVYWNREAERVYGYSAEEALGKNLGDLIIPEELRHLFRKGLEMCAGLKESGEFMPAGEVSLRRKDGSRVLVHSIHTAVCAEESEPMLFCIDVDLSERKRVEEQLRLQALVLDQIGDFVTVTDLDGIITYVNKAEARALGYSREDLIGESTEKYGEVPERGGVQREVLEETLRQGSWRGEIVNRTADGREVILDCRTQVVSDEQDNPIALAGISTDITERKRAEAEKLERERELQQTQRLESLGVLAGGIAHDFNNILMVILGNAELALRETGSLSPARESLTEISVASRQAAELCKQMLAYAGRASLEREPLDLASLIRELAPLLKSSTSSGVVLEYGLQPAVIEGDPTQLRQVVMNLVINASEAIGERRGVVTVTTGRVGYSSEELRLLDPEGGLEPGEYVRLRVSDNGCGMDEETRLRVFEPFFTTKFTGRGLGLAAVLGIVQGHGGAITVESEPEVGTTFQVILPALDSEATARPAGPEN